MTNCLSSYYVEYKFLNTKNIAPDKRVYEVNIFYFSIKTYVVGTH